MATKKKGTLRTSGEWAKHLRKYHKRKFWKGERKEAKKTQGSSEIDVAQSDSESRDSSK
jgi:hypothetical protein